MSEMLVKWLSLSRPSKRDNDESDEDDSNGLNQNEQKALKAMQREAKAASATLARDGKGGLPPSLVLGVMRRDKYQCKRCGTNQNLIVHHKGGIVRSKWLSEMGHKNTPQNIVTVCEECEDEQHEQARKDGVDSSQVTPEGDK